MDFYQIKGRTTKNGVYEIYPDFKVCRSKDLMVRGKSFYAIWDEERGLWSTDEYDVQRLVDRDLFKYAEEYREKYQVPINVKTLANFSSRSWAEFKAYISHISDNAHQLDETLTFANTKVKKTDYVSKRLSYSLEKGDISAYDELISTLYEKEERAKLEWAIGAIICGEAKSIQKFIVLYGAAGAGKSTILNIIQKLFEGYYTTFEAKALTSSSNAFSTEVFKTNPLVAIQHDGDLSKIEDNTKLNSIISHEEMTMNEKYKPSYMAKVNCFLFMATNRPVKITDGKSGIIRRLIDVKPSGNRIPPKHYQALMSKINFELGAIAYHCSEVYKSMGKNYYSDYKPLEMILQTDVFYNFVESNYYLFRDQDGASLSQAYDMYKNYCDEALVDFKLPRHKFREEMKNYFRNFDEMTRVDGKQVRSYYSGFIFEKFMNSPNESKPDHQYSLSLESEDSLLDRELADCQAQYANEEECPITYWDDVTTKLSDINTKKLHYVRPPKNHIVIDFDLKNDKGEKSLEKNLEAASQWPSTYAEFSKGGAGIHLHYIYDGDPEKLSRVYSDGIEIKVFTGKSSLRRRLSKCNSIPISHIKDGLPLKGEKNVINFESVKNEKAIRSLIKRNLSKEIHPGTKPSIDFIYKILEDAYTAGVPYDVQDMRTKVLTFAMNSTNHSDYCVKLVNKMKFKSMETSESKDYENNDDESDLVFFDVEVFPNLFLINWKYRGPGKTIVRMFNPSPKEVEELFKMKLVAFNCRRYDNHILYARYLGYNNQQLFELSQKIISGDSKNFFSEAYNISYTDIYDFAATKKSLKKWEISLGIHHKELDLPWDQPVPEEKWPIVAEYCDCDVIAEEAVFDHLQADWTARKILSKISGLCYNETTQHHTAKIIFKGDKNPQKKFIYPDLSKEFPGYKFENGKSFYKGEETGEGGYVWAKPGMYSFVWLFDIFSMHPSTAKALNVFGPYTKNYIDLVEARGAVKHKDRTKLENLLDGALIEFYDAALEGKANYTLDDLAYALKIAINIVYGLTSAKFDNPFKDPRNVDNVVAKRGALFMINLKEELENLGAKLVHIKTDSIKLVSPTPEIVEFVINYGKKYGYIFELEAVYEKMCLVNDAVYIAKYDDQGVRNKGGKHAGEWTATGAQFAHPYVFKTLFTKDPLIFEDLCETKAVNTTMYLDMNENLGEQEHDYHFIGKVGLFCPIKPGKGGGKLYREKDGKYYSVTGTKDFRWLESEIVKELGKQDDIDMRYFENLDNDAIENMSKYGDVEWFCN